MFLLLPAIFIFLLLSYIYLNDLSPFTQGLIYSLCIFIAAISIYIYLKIKKDLKQQEINRLEAELLGLQKKLQTLEDDTQRDFIERKIDALKSEIDSKFQE